MASVSAGDVVAEKYRVERLLGRGGMGYVVAARHLSLDQLVAIKFLRRHAVTDADALARFRREAKACVRLKNDHVARVFDVGVHDEEPFIVMEHLEGADLAATMRQRPTLPVAEACDYVIQACEALAEAHALGIIHRDVKLPNLFLARTPGGMPLLKVLDFGVSKTIAGGQEGGDVTQTAAVLGSPKYMSPEQMNDPRSVDARTDIWSLGVCLHRVLGGVAPFDGDTIGRLCTAVLHEQPRPLLDLRPDCPPALASAIAVCLQKHRDLRFANVAELAASLVPYAPDVERAREQTAHIATVLGVATPPDGYLPPQPTPRARLFGGRSDGLPPVESAAAWSQSTTDPGLGGRRRTEVVIVLAAAAATLALTVATVAVVKQAPKPPVAAASDPPPGLGSSRKPPSVEPPPPPVLVATTPAPTGTGIAPPPVPAPTVAAVPTTTSPPPRRPAHGRTVAKPKAPADDDRGGEPGGLPIPGDRK